MKWKEKVLFYLNEKKDPDRVSGGYKALATRLSNDLGKNITSDKVKEYLKFLDKKKFVKNLKARAKKAINPPAYEWGTKYKILKNHFNK
jgi:hypothetical protein